MALSQRLETLKRRHAQIKEKIKEEESSSAPDSVLLQHLKREKLFLKDELFKIETEEPQRAA